MTKHHKRSRGLWVAMALLLALVAGTAQAADRLRPFHLASTSQGSMAQVVAQVKQKLTDAGFTIVGSYAPYTGASFPDGQVVSAQVIGITSPAMQKVAAQTEFGGYAAVQRVSVTEVKYAGNAQVQVAYTDPTYMANAYRLKGDMADVTAALEKALGSQQGFGSENGLSAAKLRKYHYKFMMPYFTDPDLLATYESHAQAVSAVQAGLLAHKGGTSEVYQLDVPGTKATLFGVALSGPSDNECSGDRHIMSRIDFAALKSTPHLPYEMLVVDNKVYALAAKFRIAINFPDLSMMGSNSFLSIMCAPGSIKDALKAAAKGG